MVKVFGAGSRLCRLLTGEANSPAVRTDYKEEQACGRQQVMTRGLPWTFQPSGLLKVQAFLGGVKLPSKAGCNAGRIFSLPAARQAGMQSRSMLPTPRSSVLIQQGKISSS